MCSDYNIQIKMHILQPKHSKLSEKDSDELLAKLNISKAQLPKILLSDAALPDGCKVGDIVKIKRKVDDEDKSSEDTFYFRVVV